MTKKTRIRIDPHAMRLFRMRKGTITATRLFQEELEHRSGAFYAAMLTATYAEDQEWHARDITKLLKNIREWFRARDEVFRYVWVMELTKRGRPHYHVILWLPRGLKIPKPDRQGWWVKGSTKIERVRRSVGYISKYASKMVKDAGPGSLSFRFPPGSRIHGVGGLSATAARERRWWLSPVWIRTKRAPNEADMRPAKGGGWVDRWTGELFQSPWRILFDGGGIYACRGAPSP